MEWRELWIIVMFTREHLEPAMEITFQSVILTKNGGAWLNDSYSSLFERGGLIDSLQY